MTGEACEGGCGCRVVLADGKPHEVDQDVAFVIGKTVDGEVAGGPSVVGEHTADRCRVIRQLREVCQTAIPHGKVTVHSRVVGHQFVVQVVVVTGETVIQAQAALNALLILRAPDPVRGGIAAQAADNLRAVLARPAAGWPPASDPGAMIAADPHRGRTDPRPDRGGQ